MSRAQLEKILFAPPEESAGWIASAARYGLVEAQLLLGQMLLGGIGMRQDQKAAFVWFGIAAGAKHLAALNMVGRCHQNGWGTKVDLACARACFREAAERGHDWGQFNLADMLLRTAGGAHDRREAVAWLRRAARQGHAKAMNLLGRACEEGWIHRSDLSGAAVWYQEAASRGDFRAQFNVASLLIQKGEIDAASAWITRALQSNNPDVIAATVEHLAGRPEPALAALYRQARTMNGVS